MAPYRLVHPIRPVEPKKEVGCTRGWGLDLIEAEARIEHPTGRAAKIGNPLGRKPKRPTPSATDQEQG